MTTHTSQQPSPKPTSVGDPRPFTETVEHHSDTKGAVQGTKGPYAR